MVCVVWCVVCVCGVWSVCGVVWCGVWCVWCVCGVVCVCVATSFLSKFTPHTPTTLSSLEDTSLPCLLENARALTIALGGGEGGHTHIAKLTHKSVGQTTKTVGI